MNPNPVITCEVELPENLYRYLRDCLDKSGKTMDEFVTQAVAIRLLNQFGPNSEVAKIYLENVYGEEVSEKPS